MATTTSVLSSFYRKPRQPSRQADRSSRVALAVFSKASDSVTFLVAALVTVFLVEPLLANSPAPNLQVDWTWAPLESEPQRRGPLPLSALRFLSVNSKNGYGWALRVHPGILQPV
jgi:hypothetical protein